MDGGAAQFDNEMVHADLPRSLDDVRDAAWRRRLARSGDDWFTVRLDQLLTVAAGTPLRTLFPYTSHNSLHFSRCSDYPFTHDCPWIWFSSDGHFITYPPHPSLVLQGNLADPLPPPLLDTDDPHAAVDAAVNNLPATWRQVWLGDVEAGPGHQR
ncbi:DUF6193 family natural product biosynthesis protein [Micromonospora chersina]